MQFGRWFEKTDFERQFLKVKKVCLKRCLKNGLKKELESQFESQFKNCNKKVY